MLVSLLGLRTIARGGRYLAKRVDFRAAQPRFLLGSNRPLAAAPARHHKWAVMDRNSRR
jgi:hypothetical protein